MPHLSSARISELREAMSQPQTAGSLFRLYEMARREMETSPTEGAAVFFNQPGISFLREAWLASHLAATINADGVFLPKADPPDAVVRYANGEERQVEIVELYRPGRMRGDEYRAAAEAAALGCLDIEELEEGTALAINRQLPELLREQIRKKAAKTTYSRDFELLTYFAEGSFGWGREEVEPRLQEIARESRYLFRRIWLIWEKRLYRLWDAGKPGDVRPLVSPEPE